jgi:hypothetical protein
MKTTLKVTRITGGNGSAAKVIEHDVSGDGRRPPTTRVFYDGLGGVGGRIVTHLKALDLLDSQQACYLWKDSDRGDRFETSLPGQLRVALNDSELCRFGVEDPRSELQNYPQLARRYRRLLRGIPVAWTYGRGAGQWRPIGMLDYEMDIATAQASTTRVIDTFYPAWQGKKMTMEGVLKERLAESQREQPLLVVQISSAVGGLGSSTFIHDAYLLRHLLEKRGASNLTFWGVVVGPRVFQGRGPNIQHNYAALLRELEWVYRQGLQHTFINGEAITSARPPFDLLFQVDLTEWPEGEDPADKLSDTAADTFLRQIALGLHLLTAPAMHDRLQSLLVNVHEESATDNGQTPLKFLASFNAALAAVNLNALHEAIALSKAAEMAQRTIERCGVA